MDQPVDLSLVIACYNEGEHLEASVAELFAAMDVTTIRYEAIFVDDCSRDDTREQIGRIIERYPDKAIRRIFHQQNTGRGGAVTDGFRTARGEYTGYLDIDLEVHARYIPACYLAM